MQEQFQNRAEAGRQLAAKLTEYKDRRDVVILALPRGGVPVGYEVAKALLLKHGSVRKATESITK